MLADDIDAQTQTDRQTDRNAPLYYRGGVKSKQKTPIHFVDKCV